MTLKNEAIPELLYSHSTTPDLPLDGVVRSIPKFTQVESYTTFLAEFAFVSGDIVIHFFPPREAYVAAGEKARVTDAYLIWFQRTFPMVLSPVAEAYFQATKPVVVAQFVAEMNSWWMRCGGFASRLDPEGFILKFFELLDQRLDVSSKPPVPGSPSFAS